MKRLNVLKFMMLLLVGTSVALSASADGTTWLKLYNRNGTKVGYFSVSDNPKVTFTSDKVIVTTNSADVHYYSLPNMWKFTYDTGTGINDINVDKNAMQFDGSVIIFPSLEVGTDIAVYNTNGTLVMSKKATKAGDYSFPLSDLSHGVYMVKVNGKTYKIVKK